METPGYMCVVSHSPFPRGERVASRCAAAAAGAGAALPRCRPWPHPTRPDAKARGDRGVGTRALPRDGQPRYPRAEPKSALELPRSPYPIARAALPGEAGDEEAPLREMERVSRRTRDVRSSRHRSRQPAAFEMKEGPLSPRTHLRIRRPSHPDPQIQHLIRSVSSAMATTRGGARGGATETEKVGARERGKGRGSGTSGAGRDERGRG